MKSLMNFTNTSFLVACTNPRKLSKFYSSVIDSSVSKGFSENSYEIRDECLCQISFYKPSSNIGSNRIKPPSLAICFQKEPSLNPQSVIDSWVDDVLCHGGKLIEGPVLDSFGAEAWMSDEEDNKFLIFVPFMTC